MDFRSRDKLTAVRGQQLHWCCSCWRLGETGTRVLLSVLVLQSLLLTCSSALECSSTYTHSGLSSVAHGNAGRSLAGDSCRTDGACYVKVSLKEATYGQEISRGCLSAEDRYLLCEDKREQGARFKVRCCYENHCNDAKNNERRIELRDTGANERSKREMNTTAVATTGDGNMLMTTVILTAVICLVVMTTIIALVVTISIYCCCRHASYRNRPRRQRRHRQGDEELGQSDSRISFASSDCCEAIIPSGETLSNLLQSAHHHSSSPSLLVQRSVARHTILGKTLAQGGGFCDVYEGRWRNDRVLVKIYPSKYEKMWFTETEIYQISHIPHANILNFVAAEIIQRNSQTFHHLICEYHERGTLFDHLQATCIDVHGLLVLAESVAAGLAHLHSEVPNNQGVLVKPAIALCNLTSRNIYVKMDGSCCIANLSLAVKDDRSLTSQLRGRPLTDPRYLAPEFLERTTDIETMDFATLKKADMYSFALVLWEIARRCWIQGLVEEAVLPYSDAVPSEQTTVEEMRELVCVQERRPPLADQWSMDESMGVVLRVMKECWHPKSDVRLTALRVKKTLHKLGDSVRPLLDKNGKLSMQYEFDREKFHS